MRALGPKQKRDKFILPLALMGSANQVPIMLIVTEN
jgi:hypothetical protein